MEMKVKALKGEGVPVIFGPKSNPEIFKIDFLVEARRRLSVGTMDFDECELEIGDRLGGKPYATTDRARAMPQTYLCEGSVWLNFISPDGRRANISLVPHLDRTGHGRASLPIHHNFDLYWTDFDGSPGFERGIPGHFILVNEPIVIRMSCGEETRKGTITVKR